MASSKICFPGTVSSTPACAFGVDGPLEAGAPTTQGGMSREEAVRWKLGYSNLVPRPA